MDIFSYAREEKMKKDGPLARRMSPRSLDEFVGQEHLLGENMPLRRAVEGDLFSSFIFYGPPGTGKTALARIIAINTRARFARLNAVTAGVKDVRAVVEEAKENQAGWDKKTILFIDEIHRFNKAQQDALLPAVEEGLVYLIGATTENPFFSIIPPLLSRSLLFTFESLPPAAVKQLLFRALKDEGRGLGKYHLDISGDALDYLVQMADGDARIALNALEISAVNFAFWDKDSDKDRDKDKGKGKDESRGKDEQNVKYGEVPEKVGRRLSLEQVKNAMQRRNLKYDYGGDYHYDIISAFIKSIRGSAPDAALYWLARMLEAGEDPLFIARRLIISASEDIGNADPHALPLAVAAAQAVQQVGMPEGRIPLAQATAYLASASKSNAAYMALNEAIAEVKNASNRRVPPHLRGTGYKGASKLGHGEGYLYPHDFPGHYIPQHYLPEGMEGKTFYRPSDEGCEKEIKERLRYWRSFTGGERE